MNLNGGYIIINKDDANIYAKANEALTNGKPILFYENDTTCYYIDTIVLSGDDIVLTKGGKTITVTDANAVSESGSIQPITQHLYKHCINASYSGEDNDYVYIEILNNSNTPLTFTDISSDTPNLIGTYNSTSENTPSIMLQNIKVYSGGDIEFFGVYDNASISTINNWNINDEEIVLHDNIIQLL